MPLTPDPRRAGTNLKTKPRPQSDSVVVGHLQAGTLKAALNIEALIGLGTIKNALSNEVSTTPNINLSWI